MRKRGSIESVCSIRQNSETTAALLSLGSHDILDVDRKREEMVAVSGIGQSIGQKSDASASVDNFDEVACVGLPRNDFDESKDFLSIRSFLSR